MLLRTNLAFAAPAADPHALVETLRARFADPEGSGCLTGLVERLRAQAGDLSPEDRAFVTSTLTPWKTDFAVPMVQRPVDPHAPPSAPVASCWDLGSNQLNSEHFSVQWDGNPIRETTAQGFFDALEDGWQVEIEELGWEAPLQTSRHLIPAYVQQGNYQGAHTSVDTCGASYAPYIVENLGGHDTVLETWENASQHSRGYYDYGMEDAFDDAGLDIRSSYADFLANNIVMDYNDRRYLPLVDERDLIRELPADDDVSGRNGVQG